MASRAEVGFCSFLVFLRHAPVISYSRLRLHPHETAFVLNVNSQDSQLLFLLSVAYRKIGASEKAEWTLAQYRKLGKAAPVEEGEARRSAATSTGR